MPYSLKELKNNQFWNDIQDADEKEYNDKINLEFDKMSASGSTMSSNQNMRDANGNMLLFEDVNSGMGLNMPHQFISVFSLRRKYKSGPAIDLILKRDITQLFPKSKTNINTNIITGSVTQTDPSDTSSGGTSDTSSGGTSDTQVGTPTLTVDPISIITNPDSTIYAEQGVDDYVEIVVDVNGTAPIFRWYKESIPLVSSEAFSGVYTKKLRITNLNVANSGYYNCVISNSKSTVSSTNALVAIATEQDTGGGQGVCFGKNANISMANGKQKVIQRIKLGDVVKTKNGIAVVSKIYKTPIHGLHRMVKLNGMYLTDGHPVCINNKWKTPDEVKPAAMKYVDYLYNLELKGGDTVYANNTLSATLGKWNNMESFYNWRNINNV
jgi:hypothetical protein